jgi:hypothetical protein
VTRAVLQRDVIEEVQAVRDEIAREHDHDIDTILEASRREELKPRAPDIPSRSSRGGRPNQAPDCVKTPDSGIFD